MKLSGVKYLANQGVENIWKNKMMAFATFCVLLISLLLVGLSTLFYININSMILGLNDQNEVVVIMNRGVSDDVLNSAESALNSLSNVKNVEFRSKEDALEETKESHPAAKKIFEDYVTNADFMPDGFKVTVNDIDDIEQTCKEIEAIDGVQEAQSNPQVAEFLRELRKAVTLITGAVVIALAIVSMIIISNTTKASVFARREEIQIMKYVGATNAFIRMPFFVEGMVTGFFAGGGAFFVTWGVYRTIYDVVTSKHTLVHAFGGKNIIPFSDISLWVGIAYIVAGSLIGAIGSVISTRKHIDV
ncbi:MAG: permease-like cell division protein FtsX [Ruminococcus sp.]|nr:permease-like cell division protein FtsX [Ruminococcus sp.]